VFGTYSIRKNRVPALAIQFFQGTARDK
jgi:hypothetical protein